MARLTKTTITAFASLASISTLLGACATDDLVAGDSSGGDPGGQSGDFEGEEPISEPVFPTEHPRIYLGAHRTRLAAALAEGTPEATRFREVVDRWTAGEDIWGFEAWNAALLGQLTGDARYCTRAVATVEAQVSAAEARIAEGSAPEVAHDSYLHVGAMIGDLALVYDWCHDQVTAGQRQRWFAYANQAIWNVWHHAEARWGGTAIPWSGWSTNNPSNNYHYSFLRATMLVGLATKGELPEGDTWIAQFRTAKIAEQLVPTFDEQLVGGASREGTGYGVAMRELFELYDLWYATTGEKISSLTGHSTTSLYAFIHQTMPTLDRVAPYGDQSRDATAAFYDYHRNYLQELAHINGKRAVAGRAKRLLEQSTVQAMRKPENVAYDFLYDNREVAAEPLDALNTTYHAPGIGHVYMRSGWDTGATWLGLVAGAYTESHAHQDQGSLMIFKGDWLAHDSVIHSRTGINQDVGSHGLVRIDRGGTPLKQHVNTVSRLEALAQGPGWVHVAADVTPAYQDPAVSLVQRELVYLSPDVIVVYDRVRTAAGTTQTWQLPTPVAPVLRGGSATITNGGHTLEVTRVGGGALTPYRYPASEYGGGYRLDGPAAGGDNRFLHVLALDGAARAVTAAGSSGVTLALADGRTATVTFERDAIGAVLTLDGATTTLGTGVAALPRE